MFNKKIIEITSFHKIKNPQEDGTLTQFPKSNRVIKLLFPCPSTKRIDYFVSYASF